MKNRREFLQSCARVLGAGALISFAAAQVAKEKRLRYDPKCVRITPCSECPKSQACTQSSRLELPSKLSKRRPLSG